MVLPQTKFIYIYILNQSTTKLFTYFLLYFYEPIRERISQEFRRSTLSPTIADNSSFTRTSLMSNHNSSTRRSSSPHRPSSPTRRALSPSRSGRRSPERSILKSSPGYRSSSPDRSTDEYLDGFENGVMYKSADKDQGLIMVPQLSLSRLVSGKMAQT